MTARARRSSTARRTILVWEPGKNVPIYALPTEDVALDSHDAEPIGVRGFDDPDLAGYVTVAWDSLEHWYEEDEEVFVHPRDPFVRVDALRSTRNVRVERDGQLLAESDAPILVFETGLPTRYYLPETTSTARYSQTATCRPGARTRDERPTATSSWTNDATRTCSGTTRRRSTRSRR
jgi:hypothetical protein